MLPRALSSDLIQIINQWPSYRPADVHREDEVNWVLTSNGNFTIKSIWEKLSRRFYVVHWHKLSLE